MLKVTVVLVALAMPDNGIGPATVVSVTPWPSNNMADCERNKQAVGKAIYGRFPAAFADYNLRFVCVDSR